MGTYTVRDVERVLRLPESTIRGLIKAGFVAPARGPRREYRFTFQDLIVLRAARALIEANVPRRRINRALKDLRQHLPETMPLSGLSISAIGDRIVVRDGHAHWQVDDGQYLLGLDVSMEGGTLRVIDRIEQPAPRSQPQEDWFAKAVELETTDPAAALKAYARAVEIDGSDGAAWTNWGRLLHEQGQMREAERIYRKGLAQCEPDALLHFNLAVLLDDLGRVPEAIEHYQHAIELDPNLADAHFNIARLYESLGKEQHAIRHLGQYRKLMNRR
ncbi:MAG TPA: tetratricopeptide repeat protein [Steroidobacteraceae bacterium]